MKAIKSKVSLTALAGFATITAACIWTCAPQANAAVNYSPGGVVWDCSISGGGQKGLAMISFNEDGNLIGYQVLTATPKSASATDPTYGRTLGGEASRGNNTGRTGGTTPTTGTGGSTTTAPVVRTNLYGFVEMRGVWRYDLKGRVIGNFTIPVAGATPDAENETHGIGFLAKVVPERRITIIASAPNGSITYSGVPTKDMPDLSGNWYATKVKNKQKSQEFFALNSFAVDNPWLDAFPELGTFPNVYFTSDGQGAGYTFVGVAMVSSRKQVGFAFQQTALNSTNSSLSAVLGSLATRKTFSKVSATGVEHPYVPISYTAVLTAE